MLNHCPPKLDFQKYIALGLSRRELCALALFLDWKYAIQVRSLPRVPGHQSAKLNEAWTAAYPQKKMHEFMPSFTMLIATKVRIIAYLHLLPK